MELRRKGLEVGVLGKAILGVAELTLGAGLQMYFSWAHGGSLGDEVVLVDGF